MPRSRSPRPYTRRPYWPARIEDLNPDQRDDIDRYHKRMQRAEMPDLSTLENSAKRANHVWQENRLRRWRIAHQPGYFYAQ